MATLPSITVGQPSLDSNTVRVAVARLLAQDVTDVKVWEDFERLPEDPMVEMPFRLADMDNEVEVRILNPERIFVVDSPNGRSVYHIGGRRPNTSFATMAISPASMTFDDWFLVSITPKMGSSSGADVSILHSGFDPNAAGPVTPFCNDDVVLLGVTFCIDDVFVLPDPAAWGRAVAVRQLPTFQTWQASRRLASAVTGFSACQLRQLGQSSTTAATAADIDRYKRIAAAEDAALRAGGHPGVLECTPGSAAGALQRHAATAETATGGDDAPATGRKHSAKRKAVPGEAEPSRSGEGRAPDTDDIPSSVSPIQLPGRLPAAWIANLKTAFTVAAQTAHDMVEEWELPVLNQAVGPRPEFDGWQPDANVYTNLCNGMRAVLDSAGPNHALRHEFGAPRLRRFGHAALGKLLPPGTILLHRYPKPGRTKIGIIVGPAYHPTTHEPLTPADTCRDAYIPVFCACNGCGTSGDGKARIFSIRAGFTNHGLTGVNPKNYPMQLDTLACIRFPMPGAASTTTSTRSRSAGANTGNTEPDSDGDGFYVVHEARLYRMWLAAGGQPLASCPDILRDVRGSGNAPDLPNEARQLPGLDDGTARGLLAEWRKDKAYFRFRDDIGQLWSKSKPSDTSAQRRR